MLYSEPRLTLDVDLAVALDSGQIAVIPQFFPAPHFYCPPDEVIQADPAFWKPKPTPAAAPKPKTDAEKK